MYMEVRIVDMTFSLNSTSSSGVIAEIKSEPTSASSSLPADDITVSMVNICTL